jgi:hypothetical protein
MECQQEVAALLGVNIPGSSPHPVIGSGFVMIPSNVQNVVVELWGGGGGGSAGQTVSIRGSGGGGGAWIRAAFIRPSDGKINYSVGTGGQGGVFPRTSNGNGGSESNINYGNTSLSSGGGGGGNFRGGGGSGGRSNITNFIGDIKSLPGETPSGHEGGASPHGGHGNSEPPGSGGNGGMPPGGAGFQGANGQIIFFY